MSTNQKRTIELLCPAKNIDCAIAAINNGADAIYIGGPGFGARKNAGNSLDDIKQLVEHAHLFNVKIYVTINTLLFDAEIQEANQLIHKLYKIGVDAIIIQDMGILETKLPPIPIHASTQTDNRTIEKVQFLENIGLDQVVLARELSLDQIKNIKKNTSVPLEYFIHGALCICYSGQCYMSESINKRSANRGECAQPCRLKYSLKDKNDKVLIKDKHLLSLKDLNLSENIEELIDAGIFSFKIEGRLKDKDYVANITAHYRQLIDSIIEQRNDLRKSSSGYTTTAFSPEVSKSFNRGFTSYFVNDRINDIWSIDSPKSLGEEIGIIKSISKDHFIIESPKQLSNGDGLCFYTKHKELTGIRVNKAIENKVYPNQMKDLKNGLVVYRNFDKTFNDIIGKNASQRKLSIDLYLEEKSSIFSLSIIDEDGISTTLEKPLTKQTANNPDKSREQIIKQLSKLGASIFAANKVHLKLNEDWFFQAKELNAFRRELIDLHQTTRINSYQRKEISFTPSSVPFPSQELNFTANIVNEKALEFYKRHGVTKADWGFEKQTNVKGAELMRTKHCLLYMNNQCLKDHPETRKQLPLSIENKKDKYNLEFDCKNCEMIVKRMSSS